MTTKNCCNQSIKNQRSKPGASVLRLLLIFPIAVTLVVTSCADMAPPVYEGPLTERTVGPMKLEKGKQYLIFLEARIGPGTGGGRTHPTLGYPKSPQVVTIYDPSGSAIPLIPLDTIYEYYGSGKAGISVARFKARESGLQYYEIAVDRLAWEKFAEEYDWGAHAIKGLNKIVIRPATMVKSFELGGYLVFIAVYVGVIVWIVWVIYRNMKKRRQPD